MMNAPRRTGDGSSAERNVRIFFRFGGVLRGSARVSFERARQVERVNGVAALGSTVLNSVLPDFFERVLLLFAPRRTSREVDRFGICGPRERVDLFVGNSDGERFTAVWRDQVNLRDLFVGIRVFAVIVGVVTFPGRRPALGEKRNPVSVR